jgi:hypothetical protein
MFGKASIGHVRVQLGLAKAIGTNKFYWNMFFDQYPGYAELPLGVKTE